MVSDQAGARRTDVLAALKSAGEPMTIDRIARQLRVHPNTVRFHLDKLLADGRVERVLPHRRRPGRPPLLFRAVRGMDPAGPRRYRMLAEILTFSLANDPDSGAKALDAGHAFGRALASADRTGTPVHRLVDLLDELGFAPERTDDHTVGLRHCPFLEIAQHSSAVVCPIHLGLMRGALETWSARITVDRLEPFVEPDLCLARLTTEGEDK